MNVFPFLTSNFITVGGLDAIRYTKKRRHVLPMAYSTKKIVQATNFILNDNTICTEDYNEAEIDPKAIVRTEIQQKLNAMNNMFIELDENELDTVQNILEDTETDEEFGVLESFDLSIDGSVMDTSFNTSNINGEQSSFNDVVDIAINEDLTVTSNQFTIAIIDNNGSNEKANLSGAVAIDSADENGVHNDEIVAVD